MLEAQLRRRVRAAEAHPAHRCRGEAPTRPRCRARPWGRPRSRAAARTSLLERDVLRREDELDELLARCQLEEDATDAAGDEAGFVRTDAARRHAHVKAFDVDGG